MNPHDFLSAVLPTTGTYCVVELSTKTKKHTFTPNIEEIYLVAKQHADHGHDAYFALATFGERQTRAADNALVLRAFFIDLDVGESKPYKNKKDAANDLLRFVEETQLPSPWLVSSGGGLHAYWPFTEDVPVAKWRPAAERFKRLCQRHTLAIDFAVTADVARVLRVPGTVNYKDPENPRKVRLLVEGDPPSQFEALAERLEKEINGYEYVETASAAIAGTPLKNLPPTTVKLFDNIATHFKTILQRTRDGDGCEQLLHYVANAADDGMEPLWRAMLSIAKYSDDADKATVLLSKLHPYDPERMRNKLREIKGPYTCAKIEGVNPGGCADCKHRTKVKSPIVLGREVMADEVGEKIIVSEENPQIYYVRPDPPKDFFFGKNGGVYHSKLFTDKETGETKKRDICLIQYDVFVTGSLTQDPEHNHINVVAYQPSGVREIAVPARALVSKDDTLKALGANLVYATGGNDKDFYEFIKRSASDMTVLRGPRKVPDTYGWQAEGSFVIAGKEYLTDGSVATAPTGEEHANLLPITTPVGDIDTWRNVIRMLIEKKRYDILLVVLASFGAPLMDWTGYKGMLFNVQSHETGTGKSVSLALAASVYGHPTDYLVTPDTSVVTTQLRMGNLHNLPLIMDEVTYKTRGSESSEDWVSKFLLDLTMGKSKERMEASVTKERKNIVRWATLAIMSSNSSMVDALTSRNYTTNGELQRLLEIDMHSKLMLDRSEEELLTKLQSNYGLAGHKYIRWLVTNRQVAKGVLDEVNELLRTRFKMQGHERFWLAGLSAAIAAGIICSGQYAQVCNFPIKEILAEAKKLVDKSRGVVVDNVRTAADVLHAFIRENYGNFIIVRKRGGELAASLGVKDVVDETITRSSVKGRIEHGFKPGVAGVYIEKAVLNQHCHRMSYNSVAFKKELSEKYHVMDDVKKNLFSHTKVKSVRVNATCIELPENELEDDTEVAG